VDYTYTVVAHAPGADSTASPASAATSAAPPIVPAEAPADAPTTLTTTDGALSSINPSQQITVTGSGFLPYSSVTVVLYSSPVVLGAAVADAHGGFSKLVTLPADLAAGQHNIVASGVDASSSIRLVRMPVTYTAAITAGGGTSPAIGSLASTGVPAEQLASTGVPAYQLAIWAIAAILAGGLLCGFSRRGNVNQPDAA
jgi:titin